MTAETEMKMEMEMKMKRVTGAKSVLGERGMR